MESLCCVSGLELQMLKCGVDVLVSEIEACLEELFRRDVRVGQEPFATKIAQQCVYGKVGTRRKVGL